jgi:hypothetical protein
LEHRRQSTSKSSSNMSNPGNTTNDNFNFNSWHPSLTVSTSRVDILFIALLSYYVSCTLFINYEHKVDMYPYGLVVMSDCQRDLRLELSRWTNHGMSWVGQHVSWLVMRRCEARRRWSTTRWRSSRDMPCRWTGSGEGRTWGLDRGIRRPDDLPRWLRMKTERKYPKPTAFVFYIMIPFSDIKNCQFQLVSQ